MIRRARQGAYSRKVGAALAVLMPVLVAAPAGSAAAQSCDAPPGTSAIDEYCESLPFAEGDRGPAPAESRESPLAPVTDRALADAGPEGEALASFAKRGVRSIRAQPRPPTRRSPDELLPDGSLSASAITSGAGGGVTFALVLTGVAALLGGVRLAGRRNPSR